ncbi:MAG: VCBS repeat-containing protein [Polyangiaceae bacterium]
MLFAEVDMGKLAFDVRTGDLDGDAIDEILVKTLDEVHLLTLTPKGALVELLRFSPTPPPELRVAAGSPGFGDANHDGRIDVLLCATFETKGGGTRGGQTWFAPWKAEGGFADLVVLESAPCMAVAMGDVTGDGQAELFIAHTGNPWQKEQPNGEVAWRSRAGRQWTPRGRLPTRTYPDRLTLLEVTGDGILDVVVSHGWDHDDPTVLLVGGKNGLRAAPSGSPPPAEPDKETASARFDDDDMPDAVVVAGAKLQLLRTRPLEGEVIRRFEPAPHPVPPPPPTRPASPPAP